MVKHLAILSLLLTIVSCASRPQLLCESYFASCDKVSERPECEVLVAADPTVYITDVNRLYARVSAEDVIGWFGLHADEDRFALAAARAESIWYFDNSGRMDGGMWIGTEGLIALDGCTALAQMDLVIYN